MFTLTGMFTTSLLLGYSGAIMPGPLLSVAIGESARRGLVAGPLLVLGHALLELAVIVLLLIGLSQVLGSKLVTGGIGVIGGLVLFWMGYGMIKGSGATAERTAELGAAARERRSKMSGGADIASDKTALLAAGGTLGPVASGAVVSIANPYWTLWWATAGAALLTTAAQMGPGGVTAFFLGHIAADLSWYGFVALGISVGRNFWEAETYRWLILFSGVFLLALGALFLYYGVTSLV